ncbi:sugar phosphate nucleotidyltransferase [Microcoleus sp. FACHB-672]|uniref:sugar phosphate nucleotidyltransferase n=1 Tax=Microcoleus sp. FACHB-672 TaxID=2692825 RepID=UPI001682A988|nr:sugar phosphate nucleotidyltransferase [Microcoleus sp. FACHB-672]MBD2043538.1 GHMP kinase [Microcoleus sp. FACHB-672]
MKIFVPGRLCLFGEHSDWAGGYRSINPDLEKGYALIAGTNQGLYAEVKPHPTQFILRISLSDGSRQEIQLPMDEKTLLAEAEKGGFFSYAAGVAYQFLTQYGVFGLEIDNYLTDLPAQKGLASSAAICVLVARAFNRVYKLKMMVRQEMELAYLGEILTPSRCGRMDQACAYGSQPILMIFDGDCTDVIELKLQKNLFFVIVDLGAGKNTKEILNRLNQCYPFADNEVQQNVQKYLGAINSEITQQAVEALEKGDAEQIGALMKRAQAEFDQHLIPACPSELTARVLHQLLNYEPIQPFILGGKGVGSQGDGSVQFIVKDEESQQQVVKIIERDFPQMQSLKLTLQAEKKVRKAVIPAAGFGTRLFPATKAIKKELFPIIDKDGRAKPVILAIVEEALSAGIEEVGIVVQTGDRELFENFFKNPPAPALFKKLSQQNQEYCRYLEDLGHRITILTQDVQEGYGHAVFCAREWVGDQPFLLMLGDHVYSSETETSCARQIIEIYEQVEQSVLGLTVMSAEIISKAGCVAGFWQEPQSILSITQLYEKPTIEYARQHLRVDGMPEDQFLCAFGLYVFTPKIFDSLEENINNNLRDKGEFQLTSGVERLRQDEGITGYLVKGKCFDTGLPETYWQTLIDFRKSDG